ncbi:MAG: glycosyltransferase [Candidatus Gastranaerophilales bacterium]|nr:glycosyltransferase [Candidatus Gastranaerophilales bacterium]
MKILVLSPASIIGEMIIKGIARGFEALGADVLLFDVKEIDKAKIKNFNPDVVFGMDYIFFHDENLETFIDSLNVPCVYYFIDDPKSVFAHGGRENWLDKLNKRKNSIIYSWDEKYLPDFTAEAHYLSTGIDFELYKQDDPSIYMPPSRLLFAGRPLTDRRESIIAEVVKAFAGLLTIYCYPPHFEQSVKNMREKGFLNEAQIEDYKKSYRGFLPDEKHLAAAYHRADMILNITLEQGFSSMNSRVLEGLATGSFLISDYIEDTAKYFDEGKDLILYKNTDELINYIREYKDAPEKRAKIKGNAVSKIEKNHTLASRAEIILERIKAL